MDMISIESQAEENFVVGLMRTSNIPVRIKDHLRFPSPPTIIFLFNFTRIFTHPVDCVTRRLKVARLIISNLSTSMAGSGPVLLK